MSDKQVFETAILCCQMVRHIYDKGEISSDNLSIVDGLNEVIQRLEKIKNRVNYDLLVDSFDQEIREALNANRKRTK